MASATAPDPWLLGQPYEGYVGRWSRRVAPEFLAGLGVPPGRRWLDVGCGTGALSQAILDHAAPSQLVAVDPSAGFIEVACASLAGAAMLCRAEAGALPMADGAVDVVVSGLVLNFIPDLPGALAEMLRVLAPGGVLGAYVWDYAEGMALIRHFWAAASALDPRAAALDEAARFPLCRPDALRAALQAAGARDAEVSAIDIATPFAGFDDYWAPFLGGQGPAPAYLMSLDEGARAALAGALRARLPFDALGRLPLQARAWAVRATRPRPPEAPGGQCAAEPDAR